MGACDRHNWLPLLYARRSVGLAGNQRIWLVLASLWAGSVTLTSCGSSVLSGPAIVAYDSAGVEIVDFSLDSVAEVGRIMVGADWVFGNSPELTKGVPLSDVRDAKLLHDGRVAIINGVAEEVLVVDPRDDRLQRFGGEGEGPGKVEYIISVWEIDDGIAVYDQFRRALVVFGPGDSISSWRPPRYGVPGPVYPELVIPDGREYFVGDLYVGADHYVAPDQRGQTSIRRRFLFARIDQDGVDTIAIVPGDTGIPKGFGISAQPFGATYGVAKADSGIWLGDSAIPEVRLWSESGDLKRIVRWRSTEDPTLTRRRVRAARDRVLAGRSKSVQANIRRTWRDQPFPEEMPAWGRIIQGSDGVLWVSSYPGPEAEWTWLGDPYPSLEWLGIGNDGRPVGMVVSPSGLRVTAFSSDFVIGIHRDSLGVETVRRHLIERGETQSNLTGGRAAS